MLHTLLALDIKYVDQQSTPIDIINKVIAYAIIAAFILSLAYVLFGGFKFIFSGGDEGKIKGAMGTIRHAIIGLLITIFAVVIVQIIGQIVGIDVISEIFNYDEIGANINNLLERLTGNGGGGSTGGLEYDFGRDF